jgi:hypothetical protein
MQDLAEELVDMFTASKMTKVFFCNSGSEANDTQVRCSSLYVVSLELARFWKPWIISCSINDIVEVDVSLILILWGWCFFFFFFDVFFLGETGVVLQQCSRPTQQEEVHRTW